MLALPPEIWPAAVRALSSEMRDEKCSGYDAIRDGILSEALLSMTLSVKARSGAKLDGDPLNCTAPAFAPQKSRPRIGLYR